MVFQVVEEGEVHLHQSDHFILEPALLLELNLDFTLLKLCHRLTHEFDEHVTIEVDDGSVRHVFEEFGTLLLATNDTNFNEDIHESLSIYF